MNKQNILLPALFSQTDKWFWLKLKTKPKRNQQNNWSRHELENAVSKFGKVKSNQSQTLWWDVSSDYYNKEAALLATVFCVLSTHLHANLNISLSQVAKDYNCWALQLSIKHCGWTAWLNKNYLPSPEQGKQERKENIWLECYHRQSLEKLGQPEWKLQKHLLKSEK